MTRPQRASRAAIALLLAVLLTFSPNVFALGPFEKNADVVQKGLDAYDKGDYEQALKDFEEAEKQFPNSAPLEFDRANTLYRLGRLDEARQIYDHVQQMDQSELKAKDFYNLGNTLAAMNDKKGAIAAFRKALRLDPNDDEARHNLEVLLRNLKQPDQKGQDGGTPDGGAPDSGQPDSGTPKKDGGSDAGRPDGGADGGFDGGHPEMDGGMDAGTDGGQGDAGSDGGVDGGQGDAGQGQGDGGSPQDGGSGKGKNDKSDKGDGGEDGGAPDQTGASETDAGVEELPDGGSFGMTKDEADKLLDAMKQNEKNLQLWRFQQRKRRTSDKDW